MNYALYLQNGGPVQAKDDMLNLLVDLVTRALNNDEEANGVLQELLKTNPELKETVMQIAQSITQGNEQAQMKCGGRVKKKEQGDKIQAKKEMAAGGKCPCTLKKVGGRLIEIDSCTGQPILNR